MNEAEKQEYFQNRVNRFEIERLERKVKDIEREMQEKADFHSRLFFYFILLFAGFSFGLLIGFKLGGGFL